MCTGWWTEDAHLSSRLRESAKYGLLTNGWDDTNRFSEKPWYRRQVVGETSSLSLNHCQSILPHLDKHAWFRCYRTTSDPADRLLWTTSALISWRPLADRLVLIANAYAWLVRVPAVNVSRVSLLLVVNLRFTPRSPKGSVHKLLSTKSRQKDSRWKCLWSKMCKASRYWPCERVNDSR